MANRLLRRREFLAVSAGSAIAATGAATRTDAGVTPDDSFPYEVSHSVETWQDLLTSTEFEVLRLGRTEWPRSSELWDETRDGTYHCKGCALPIFDSPRKVRIDKGWAFFVYSRDNAVLTAADTVPDEYGDMSGSGALIEAHCRRCGSHLGHILLVEEQVLHCINGLSMTFKQAT